MCDVPDEGQTESWSGTVTATRTAVSSGGGGGGGGAGGCDLSSIKLVAVSADAADDAWAAGACERAALEHWDGKRWALVALPSLPGRSSIFTGIAAVSPHDVWVVGHDQGSNGKYAAIVLHWNGSRWSTLRSPTVPRAAVFGGVMLNGVSATAAGAWIAGIRLGPRGLAASQEGDGNNRRDAEDTERTKHIRQHARASRRVILNGVKDLR